MLLFSVNTKNLDDPGLKVTGVTDFGHLRFDGGSTSASFSVSPDVSTNFSDTVGRINFQSFAIAERIAKLTTEVDPNKRTYIAIDRGSHCSPRYDVIEAFKVGEKVSYAFNGDCYPDGTIVSIGKGRMARITTSTGKTYIRHKLSSSWRSSGGGTWSLVRGHHFEQNPSF